MKKTIPSPLRSLTGLYLALWLITACEVQNDGDELDSSVASAFDADLEQVLEIMESDPEVALVRCDEIIKEAKAASSPYYTGKALWYQAYIYDDILEDVSKAYFGYNEALKHLEQTDDATIIVKVNNNLAILNQYYAQYDIAASIYLKTLEYKDDIDGKLLSDIYYNLGRTYKLKGDKESFFKAEEAFTQALEVARSIDNHENIANINNQIGLMYKDLGNYEMARIAYRNTIRNYQDSDPTSPVMEYVGKAYHGIGVTYMDEDNYADAIASFERALLFKKSSGSIFITKYDLGTVLYDAGHAEEAISTWKDALTEKHNKNERVQVEIYSKLTSALAARKEYEEALNYAQLYSEHMENILNVGDQYKSENNEVIFADVIREYAEFNEEVPWYKEPWAFVVLLVLMVVAVYGGSTWYYRWKMSTKVSETMSSIELQFQNIKLD